MQIFIYKYKLYIIYVLYLKINKYIYIYIFEYIYVCIYICNYMYTYISEYNMYL
jgi:hypothetical protein